MGCYAVPAAAAVIHYFMKKKNKSMDTVHHKWLSLLLTGGATFGIVDHAWNGELLFTGPNILMDLALGVTITIVIVLSWFGLVAYDRFAKKTAVKAAN